MSLRNPERGLFTVKGLIFSLGLIASFVFVATIYGIIIRPEAEKAALASDIGVDTGSAWSNIFIILKDYEQQICFSLLVWGIMIIAYKYHEVSTELKLLDRYAPADDGSTPTAEIDLLEGNPSINRERAGTLSELADRKSKEDDQKNSILPYVIARGLERYHMTGSVPEATDTMIGRLEVAAEQQESELSMLRYLVWAIPSIGFIGTVRGIGVALRRADEALEGDISGVTTALGVAFNSTLVALFISILLMLMIHLLQSTQEGLILRLQTFCREQILDKLFERSAPEESTEPEVETQTPNN
ncbi:MotA/TolQ/ExbB proton channel family protein [Coraliomargarita akajimensis]|uniref:MotA/TolQ/ExbB proton channel n=1 Tax=Coraliomargarita akajimensis (strain DSM 45221 / IAM 15411 / JCM 23193 / KCTC 12865 / 04OKA010-24) TaxID=583355 RepID=D5EP20_CORAD|nr:MotA/TolQ/ExbB proton channel family protein [Coraliomargarita akajimensis]ADE55530.1 MotA/TolQ/ExbB proton channel [Coraliomargarita akajimensis DSM 45221]